jgi:hypothetical protein
MRVHVIPTLRNFRRAVDHGPQARFTVERPHSLIS